MRRLLVALSFLVLAICSETSGQEQVGKEPAGDADTPHRKVTIRLKSARAADIVAAIDGFFKICSSNFPKGNAQLASTFPTWGDYKRDVILTPDDKNNTLTISAIPGYFGDIVQGAEQLDQTTPQIMMQVLIAERYQNDVSIEVHFRKIFMVPDERPAELKLGGRIIGVPGTTFWRSNRLAIHLQLTPKILPGGKVQLRVNQEVKGTSHFDISVGNGQPNFETALTTQDGQTVVTKSIRIVERIINEEKIPWLGDLPRVGYLFHKHIQHVEHSELFVILTPHVVSSREKPAGSRRNSRNAEQ